VAVETPLSYRSKRSFLHRADAGLKLLCMMAFSAAAFAGRPVSMAALSVFLVAVGFRAGLPPSALLRGGRPVAVLGLFAALGRAAGFSPALVFSMEDFLDGLLFLWSMMLSFGAASLFYAVTTAAEIRGAVAGAERALLRPVALLLKNAKSPSMLRLRSAALRPRFGLALGLMLGFLPRFLAEWELLQTANRARAGKKGVSEIKRLVPLVLNRMMDNALETAAAMEARGWLAL
jgi:energy-coupling factor transporter transmembrane protein EcfT